MKKEFTELRYQNYKGKCENACRKLMKMVGSDKLLCAELV